MLSSIRYTLQVIGKVRAIKSWNAPAVKYRQFIQNIRVIRTGSFFHKAGQFSILEKWPMGIFTAEPTGVCVGRGGGAGRAGHGRLKIFNGEPAGAYMCVLGGQGRSGGGGGVPLPQHRPRTIVFLGLCPE